jgi:hypothetical protein
MIAAAVGVILNYLCFALIGMGPALYLCPSRPQISEAAAIAPTVGFCLTSIAGTYLILMDMAVTKWAVPWLIFAVCLSILLIAQYFRKAGPVELDTRRIFIYAASFLLAAILLLLPALLGGLAFSILRGNGSDSFLYITVAGYLDHEPYSWIFKAGLQEANQLNPSYPLAQTLLHDRWTTAAILAWTSRIAGLPAVRFEYGYTLLPILLAFGPAFLIIRNLGISLRYAALTALAVCVGFWPQLVLDIRAMSQLTSIPLLLLICLIIAWIENSSRLFSLKQQLLLGIAVTSLLFHYPEAIPILMLGLGIFKGVSILKRNHCSWSLKKDSQYLVSLAITFVLSIPAGRFLMSVLARHMHVASTTPNEWYKAYFMWLYSNPLSGLWGFSIFPGKIAAIPLTFLGLLLTSILCFSIFYFLFSKQRPKNEFNFAVSLVVASLSAFFFLFVRNQLWAAGKAISFGYPFLIIALVGIVFTIWPHVTGIRKNIAGLSRLAVCSFLVIQLSAGFLRVGYVLAGGEYTNYISSHSEYRQHDWNTDSIHETIKRERCKLVALAVFSTWYSQYLGFVLGGDTKIAVLDGLATGGPGPIAPKQFNILPEYLIVNKGKWIYSSDLSRYGIASNSELALLKVDAAFWSRPLLFSIQNPNGLELDSSGLFFWMGGKKTEFRIYSPQEGVIVLKAKFGMGPSLPERNARTVELIPESPHESTLIEITASTEEIRIPVVRGVNDIAMGVVDNPSVASLPGGEARPLLLNVSRMGLALGY